jgi:hypothetical protein
MRYLLDQQSYDEMKGRKDHTTDCYVRPNEYLHHMYTNGVKCVVARALMEALKEAIAKRDVEAVRHLQLHKEQLDSLVAQAQKAGSLAAAKMLGEPFPTEEDSAVPQNNFVPLPPKSWEETGLNRSILFESILRVIYNQGRPTGQEISRTLGLSYRVVGPLLVEMRNAEDVDIAGQRGIGDSGYEYILTPRGARNVEDALKKNAYSGPVPVPFEVYKKAVKAQTMKNVVVTRQNIRKAFSDLILSDSALSEIGPAVNSGASVFFFGFPGNGKTSIAERITRLMGDYIFIPYAVEAEGQIIKIYDSIVHELAPEYQGNAEHQTGTELLFDQRWVRIKRPVVIVGGELILSMLDLTYNDYGKFYEAPFQMKANGGIFMIDDFGRQQVRPMDLLNRWIVPLEKRYDYLTTVTGKKMEVPFDELLIFSTNLDPHQLADEAFLRRIKFKIEVRDPDEAQWRKIWELVCRGRKIELDQKGVDYLIEKWYKPTNRPFRMCQPRDILDQMISIAKYNMEQPTFTPDLIDAACSTYFISEQKKDFGAKVRLE